MYAGAVYIYKLGDEQNFVEVKKITSKYRSAWDKFGFAVDVYKRCVVIGSRFEAEDALEKTPITGAGAVFISENN